jgi:hypothetical protein
MKMATSDDILRARNEAIVEIEKQIQNGLVLRDAAASAAERAKLDDALDALRAQKLDVAHAAFRNIHTSAEYTLAVARMRAAIAEMTAVAAHMTAVTGFLGDSTTFVDAAARVKEAIDSLG